MAVVETDLPQSEPPRDEVDPRRWKALAVLALVQFMIVIDITVVNVALPSIQKALHFSSSGLAWIVDGYALMAGGLLLLGGRAGDLFGRRRLFLIGTALFAIASFTSGAAQSQGMLVMSRFAPRRRPRRRAGDRRGAGAGGRIPRRVTASVGIAGRAVAAGRRSARAPRARDRRVAHGRTAHPAGVLLESHAGVGERRDRGDG